MSIVESFISTLVINCRYIFFNVMIRYFSLHQIPYLVPVGLFTFTWMGYMLILNVLIGCMRVSYLQLVGYIVSWHVEIDLIHARCMFDWIHQRFDTESLCPNRNNCKWWEKALAFAFALARSSYCSTPLKFACHRFCLFVTAQRLSFLSTIWKNAGPFRRWYAQN